MAEIKCIDVCDGNIEVKLSINKDEYGLLQNHVTDIVVLPSGKDAFSQSLTTGKLGNSNRLMLPKKMLEAFKINELEKKVPSNIYTINGNSYLLIKLRSSKFGIPVFKEE